MEIKIRYFKELNSQYELIKELLTYISRGTVSFIYSSKESHLNNAVARKEFLASSVKKQFDRYSYSGASISIFYKCLLNGEFQ